MKISYYSQILSLPLLKSASAEDGGVNGVFEPFSVQFASKSSKTFFNEKIYFFYKKILWDNNRKVSNTEKSCTNCRTRIGILEIFIFHYCEQHLYTTEIFGNFCVIFKTVWNKYHTMTFYTVHIFALKKIFCSSGFSG